MKWRALHASLPERLSERCRLVAAGEAASTEEEMGGPFVVYWMRNAARAHENPALDTALAAAHRLGVPAWIYHGVSESYPYASDRHHTFALEGARDVSAEAAERGVGYALHVEREGHRTGHLLGLCERAALVVVEDVPVEPLRTWRPALASATETPVVAVDADCVVPMRRVGRLYDRAYKYRSAVEDLRRERINRGWTEIEPEFEPFLPENLSFEPVDLGGRSIAELVAACEIDHGVGPVPGTRGGGRAGYERWTDFRDGALEAYHWRRNTPSELDGVSRMSPYLHWGHVSPFRLAREASRRNSKGAEKFIDELVTWRELAHHFCFYEPDHDKLEALPDWALETLREHESDPRPDLYDWERLSRAETDDALWNACQTSLLRHGELHNNVRMTWAKRLLEWTPNAERALELALDLNHRYALDGRDPNSYHGILWCFGAFDRPFEPERPVHGRVRPRDTDWHAGRIEMDRYEQIVTAPPVDVPPSVAVVGAGMAGAVCARTLRDHGLSVRAFDKGRGPGGRMSTRRMDGDRLQFDHGAPQFTVRDARFRQYVTAWRGQGFLATWEPRVAVVDEGSVIEEERVRDYLVGTPKMSAAVGHVADGAGVEFDTRVGELQEVGDGWRIRDAEGRELGTYDVVVVTAPAEQTAALLDEVDSPVRRAVEEVEMQPTWALMVAFEERVPVEFDAAFVESGPLAQVVRNSAKPGRPDAEAWLLHSTHAWARERLERPVPDVRAALLEAFGAATGLDEGLPSVRAARVHRWRYAEAESPLERGALWDGERRLAVAGDWVVDSRVEGAFLSGRAAAGHILRRLGSAEVPR